MTHADDVALRTDLFKMIRGKVPEQDAEDIVQATLIEALSSPTAPKEGEARRKWAFGVAKNKIADYYRRSRRETFEVPEIAGPPPSLEERDMLRWAEEALPANSEAPKTLEWMLREGDGEKLEAIAASEKLPAPRVRQRVSRLRRHLKQHWAKEVAVLAALGLLAVALFFALRKKQEDVARPLPDPSASPSPLELAKKTRKDALDACRAARWDECERGLDAAKMVDPDGEQTDEVRSARAAASAARLPPPPPSSSPAPSPSAGPSAAPTPAPIPTTPSSGMPWPTSTTPSPKSAPTSQMKGPTPSDANQAPMAPSKIDAKPLGKKSAVTKPSAPVGTSDLSTTPDFAPDFGSKSGAKK